MEFRILGRLELMRCGVEVPLRGSVQRRAMTILLVDSGHVVPMHRLIAAMWDGEPPVTARRQVQNTVAALRRALAPDDPIEPVGDGYRLLNARTDLDLFKSEVAQAKRTSDPLSAERLLTMALGRWRGPVMAGGGGLLESIGRGFEELRIDAMEDRFEALLALGRHREAVRDLRATATEHPHRQRLTGQLMVALYRSGEAAAALRAYADLDARLGEELGVEPDRAVRDLHIAILREDPGLDLRPRGAGVPIDLPQWIAPAQLPPALPGFVGRTGELALLDRLLADDARGRLAVITGPGGIGKTTLANRWAHAVADQFPEGQLYADLRGFDPGGPGPSPETIVRGFLEALGVPADRQPGSSEARTGLYRSLLANRRVLVVLDNARDAAQVRPLLPAGAANCVLVTSRNRLSGLLAAYEAVLVDLPPFTAVEALAVVVRRVGRDQVEQAPDAADRLIDLCGGLPLAVAVAATRVGTGFPLSEAVDQLAATTAGLARFEDDDPLFDLRTVFSWSVRSLSGPALRLFALHPGPDCSLDAAASLAAATPADVQGQLRELRDASLVAEQAPGRFTLHDLLREYACELAESTLDRAARNEATARMFDHYLYSSYAARAAIRNSRMFELDPLPRGVVVSTIPDAETAMNWYTSELATLTSIVHQSSCTERSEMTWRLAWTMVGYLGKMNYRGDIEALLTIAAETARKHGQAEGEVWALRLLTLTAMKDGRIALARDRLSRAETAADVSGDPETRAEVAMTWAFLLSDIEGAWHAALEYAYRGFELFDSISHESGKASALSSIGWYLGHLDRTDEALDYCQRALTALRALGDVSDQIATMDSIAFILHRAGRSAESVTAFAEVIEFAKTQNELLKVSESLEHLGQVHLDLGDRDAAAAAWSEALAIFEDCDPHNAARMRELLDSIPTHAPSATPQ